MASKEEGDAPVQIMGAGLSGLAAAIVLAKAGREVHVHDIREDSGSRFDGDFQGLENWTSDTDFLDELREWGIDSSEFKITPFHEVDVIHPDDEVTRAWSPTIAFRVIERGTASHTIDQGLKRQAIAAGVHIHYKSRVEPEECHIVAAGPRDTSAVAFGEIFETSHPNHVAFHFNDKLAPGAYAYLIVIDGIGLICTCLWRKQQKSGRFLDETIAWYDQHYPELKRIPIKRVGGKGDFTINREYTVDGRHYVGEAGGLQDFMWGFGMRYAITSGVFAAKDLLGEVTYDDEVRKRILPSVKTSVSNRWLMNRVGDRAFKQIAVNWYKDQTKRQDGLPYIANLFRPDLKRKIVYHLFGKRMLKKVNTEDGRTIHRLPYRNARKRDVWEPSEEALKVREQWRQVRRGGGTVSFDEEE
ncbi:MAG: NAD(P)-binding protein [Candidatus Thalassarchaeaceae archaeon]|nr:NAD(P)-binding protein [Candidatus Thalassarchaeaceae archaeon]MDP7043369.1 NAD(P)-binding protein [Candidatus Thalassarchaeaceae archaeon]